MNRRDRALALLRLVPLAVMLGLIAAAAFFVRGLSVEELLRASPQNPWLAAGFLLLLYALKSLSVVFPIPALYLAGGMLFPLPAALAVGAAGIAVCLSLPYWVGRWSAGSFSSALARRYPKVRALLELQRQNDFFFSFFVRVIGFLPCDVVSLYLGSSGLPFGSYLAGGLLGMLPGLFTVTLMGASIQDPSSPQFLISAAVTALLSAASLLAAWRLHRRQPDAHPVRARSAALKDRAKKLKRDIPALFFALKDPKTPIRAKILAGVTVGYALSPIDLIPDFIPVLGYLDDVILLPALIALTVRAIPKEIWDQSRALAAEGGQNGKRTKWYFGVPVVLIWLALAWLIVKAVWL